MKYYSFLLSAIFMSAYALPGYSATNCKLVRFSDVGWTDISTSTALASIILESLGYETKSAMLSVPVTYSGLKNHQVDVFLGNWMPSMEEDIAPYQKEGSVETIGTLLKSARYTLAVPKYVADQGVQSIQDLNAHKEKFHAKIFGVESGNSGNRFIQAMITENAFQLGNWKQIESSEQAMLMEVARAEKKKDWIVFLGWEPHPMNMKFPLHYLSGGEKYFGTNKGTSVVYINTRKDYGKECPNVAQFLKNYTLTIQSENTMMNLVLDNKLDVKVAAKTWLKENLKEAKSWLRGVKTLSGDDAYQTLEKTVLGSKNIAQK